MSVEIQDYGDVRERVSQLQCRMPTAIALLPRNFETARSKGELLHEASAPTVRVLWRQAGVQEDRIQGLNDTLPYVHEKSVDWIGPTIFVGAMLLSQNSQVVTVALGVISNYLTDLLKGVTGPRKVKLDVVVERAEPRSYKRIHYEGEPEGLADLAKIVREVGKLE